MLLALAQIFTTVVALALPRAQAGWHDAVEQYKLEIAGRTYEVFKVIPINDEESEIGLAPWPPKTMKGITAERDEFERLVRPSAPDLYDREFAQQIRYKVAKFAFARYEEEDGGERTDGTEMPAGFFSELKEKSQGLSNPSGMVAIFRADQYAEPVATLQFTHTDAASPDLPLTSIFDVTVPKPQLKLAPFPLFSDRLSLDLGRAGKLNALMGRDVELNKLVTAKGIDQETEADLVPRLFEFAFAPNLGKSIIDRPTFVHLERGTLRERTRAATQALSRRFRDALNPRETMAEANAPAPPSFKLADLIEAAQFKRVPTAFTQAELQSGRFRVFPDRIFAVSHFKRMDRYTKMKFVEVPEKNDLGIDLGPMLRKSPHLRLLMLSREHLLTRSLRVVKKRKGAVRDQLKSHIRETTRYRGELLQRFRTAR
jgi:hypothetical protein